MFLCIYILYVYVCLYRLYAFIHAFSFVCTYIRICTYILLYIFSFWWFLVIRLLKHSSSFQPNQMCVNLVLSILKYLYLVKIINKKKKQVINRAQWRMSWFTFESNWLLSNLQQYLSLLSLSILGKEIFKLKRSFFDTFRKNYSRFQELSQWLSRYLLL